MSRETTTTTEPIPAWRSPWVIGWVALVAIVLVVNAVMVYLAVTTNPGLVRDDYYERGREMEATIASRLSDGPGWSMSIDTPADTRAESDTTIRFFVVDKAGQPVTPDGVTYFAYRPSDVDRDFSLPMRPEGSGRYVVKVRFSLAGLWDTLVSVRSGGEEYLVGQRISVGQP